MTIQRMIELLEIEHECMLRGAHDDCDRNCADCELVQDDGDLHEMYTNVIALLKEQEARVMALDELTEIYVEFKGNNCPVRLTNFDLQKIVKHAVDGDCRLWTGKPTDEQRQAVKWE